MRLWGVDEEQPDDIPERMPDEEIVSTCDERVVWGGYLGHHYGHFLTECVSRLWPLLPGGRLCDLPVVFIASRPLPPFAREWLGAFGARAIEVPDAGAVRFTRMAVPEPAWRLGAWIAPEMRRIHLHVRDSLDLPAARDLGPVLWISRSGIEQDRLAYDECLLEWILGDSVAVVRPETLSLSAQVALIEGCQLLGGIVGSAFHTLMLAEQLPDRVYLCPPKVTTDYPAQDLLLGGRSDFLHALTPAGVMRAPRPPSGHRVLIPQVAKWLAESQPLSLWSSGRFSAVGLAGGEPREQTELEAAVARVLAEPLSVAARVHLGKLFEAEGRHDCAREQLMSAEDLADGNDPQQPPRTAPRAAGS